MRPLDRVTSLKLKLSIVIVAAVAITATTSTIGLRIGLPLLLRPVISAAVALAMVQLLARGMTRPLREMEVAATSLAHGDYTARVVTTSVDEVGRLAAAFNRMADELEANEQQKRDLLANVSHELRTPLTGLRAMLENLVDGVAEPSPEALVTMHGQTERLGRLVHDILELSRLESGTAALQPRACRVADLLDRAAHECRLHHPDVVVVVQHHDAPAEVTVDPDRLHQALVNLLDNAARYGATGPIELCAGRAGDELRIEVADHGPGIPPEERARVFERFYRADRARAQHDGGAGLGLAIVRWVVDLHGGQVRATANDPHGCRMTIDLPIDARNHR